jgi:UDP-glucose:(heptosyl)LPS alpha-1,3-glucosyltransferase
MRVALVLENFDPRAGGLEKWTASLAAFLLGRGHDVHVLAFGQANHTLPVKMTILPPMSGLWQRAEAVATALRDLPVDVVHDTGLGWSGDIYHPQTGSRLLSQARLIATQPPFHRLRAAISPASIRWRRQMAQLEQRQIRDASAIVAVSRLVRSRLCAQHGLREDQLTVIPNGVETARFAHDRLDPLRREARAKIGAGDSVLFLASAFNMHLKGVDTAIRALGVLTSAGADARLAVAGARADDKWHRLAADRGVKDRVAFLGPVGDMIPLFAAADALVHATRWDACSLSTIEGQAAGLPVITTATNGAAELIVDGLTGYVLPDPEDMVALSARMRALLDPMIRRRVGEAARKAAAAYDLNINLAAVEQVLLDGAAIRARKEKLARI